METVVKLSSGFAIIRFFQVWPELARLRNESRREYELLRSRTSEDYPKAKEEYDKNWGNTNEISETGKAVLESVFLYKNEVNKKTAHSFELYGAELLTIQNTIEAFRKDFKGETLTLGDFYD